MVKFIFAFLFVFLAVSTVLSTPDYDNEKDGKKVEFNGAPKSVLAALKFQNAGLVNPKVDANCRNRRSTTTVATDAEAQ